MDASRVVKAHIGIRRQIKEMGFSSEKDLNKNGTQEQMMLVYLTANKAMEFRPKPENEERYNQQIAHAHNFCNVADFLKLKTEMLEKHPGLKY